MTVSEVVKVLKNAKSIRLSWNGTLHEFDLYDSVIIDAFGSNIVAALYANGEDQFEIELAVRPLKRGDPA
jgi:hypothetical protein